jgi:NADH-quinone oxidoreductase subunit K
MIVQPVLVVAAALFSLGIYGILVRRNAVMVLLSIELILNAVNINFIMFDTMLADTMMQGQIFTYIYNHNCCCRSWNWVSYCSYAF